MTSTVLQNLTALDLDHVPDYPLSRDERLDSHFFIAWERRRWLNSDMRLRGAPECRAYYIDLINICYEQSPIGTLPSDVEILAKLLHVDPGHFKTLTRMEYGPLHKWQPCRCGDEIRLMHPVVLRTLTESIARRADNRARCEAANTQKRLARLRETLSGYHVEVAKNDAAVRWIDQWLTDKGCRYRGGDWIERAMQAWSNHVFDARREGQ